MTTLNWKAWNGERAKPSPMELPVACLFSDGAIVVGMSHKFTWDRVSNVSRNKPHIVAWREPTKEEAMQLRSNGDVMFMVNAGREGVDPSIAELKWTAWSGNPDVEGVKIKGNRLVVVELRTDSRAGQEHYVGPAKAFSWIYGEGVATVDERKVTAWRFTTAEEGALWNLAYNDATAGGYGTFDDPRIATLRTLHQIRDGQHPGTRNFGKCADLKIAIDNTLKVSGELPPQIAANDHDLYTQFTPWVGETPWPGGRYMIVMVKLAGVEDSQYTIRANTFEWEYAKTQAPCKIIAWRECTNEEREEFRKYGFKVLGHIHGIPCAVDGPALPWSTIPGKPTSESVKVETETKELFSSADGPDGMGEPDKPRETICKITIHDNRLSADRIRAVMEELGSRLSEFNDTEKQREHARKGTLHFKCSNMDELTSLFGIELTPDLSEKRKVRVNLVRRSAKGGDTGYQSCLREMAMSWLNLDPSKQVDLEQARTAAEFLSRADSTINQRGKDYDTESGERSGEPVAIAFNALTGKSITGAEVYLIQQLLKDRRQWTAQQFHYDSALDSVGFAALKSEALANERKQEGDDNA